ncbi:MAG TPA: DUF2334 domain-containing protein [Myxococcota bacterium]|nr:DUF2334 domain-containing protein [Myxococcota bacterium]
MYPIIRLADLGRPLLEERTPGYYNNEGKLLDRAAQNGVYGGGSPQFFTGPHGAGTILVGFHVVLTSLAIALLVAWPASPAGAQQLDVLVRYDDYSGWTPPEPEEALFEAVQKAGGRTLVGIIPYLNRQYPGAGESPPPLVSSFGPKKLAALTELLRRGSITPAVHGYAHGNNSAVPGLKSEFADTPVELQSRLLRAAKTGLEDGIQTKIDVFIPPWNSYDAHTLTALEESGFRVLSAGLNGVGDAADLDYIPVGASPQYVKADVEAALRQGYPGDLLVEIVHPYDFAEFGAQPGAGGAVRPSVAEVVADIDWIATQPGVRIVSLEHLRRDGDLSRARFQANQLLRTSYLGQAGVLPLSLGLTPVPEVLYRWDVAERIIWERRALASLLYGGSGVLALLPVLALRRRVPAIGRRSVRVLCALIALGTALVGVYAAQREVHVSMLLTISVGAGAFLALVAPLKRS